MRVKRCALPAALLAALLAAAPRVARCGVWGLTDVYEARRRVARAQTDATGRFARFARALR